MKPIVPNTRQRMDGVKMLARMAAASADLVFFDPQYRGGLDRLGYGNEGERQKGRASLKQMDDRTITAFVSAIEFVLKPSAHLMLWCDKFTIVERRWWTWIFPDDSLEPVDLITWDKCRIGMGYRSRTQTEFLLILQKPPKRAKGIWTKHDIPDSWPEHSDRSGHPHAKPIQLQTELIKACTKRGDLVVDPAAGSYSVMEAAHRCGRQFIGCDIG
jgi:site-specific DNA-methyltransferase (adenine-specific)